MNKFGLRLDISLEEMEMSMGHTFRQDGVSVNRSACRVFGENIEMDVSYDDLIIGKRIGQGACSSVNIAKHHSTGEKYAVKMFNVYDDSQAHQMIKEVLLLAQIDCDTIVTLKGAFYNEGHVGIILEYMDRGSLDFIIEGAHRVSLNAIGGILFQVLWGLGYLNFENIMHRDIKPANVLMNSEGHVKLSDFGISKDLQEGSSRLLSTSVGTFRYMSPERLQGEAYDSTSDIWSLGITAFQLWTGYYPWQDCSASPIELVGELESIDMSKLVSKQDFPHEFRDLLLSMLELQYQYRSAAADLLSHSFFQKLNILDLSSAQQAIRTWLLECDRSRLASSSNRQNGPFESNISPSYPMKSREAARKSSAISDRNNFADSKLDSSIGSCDTKKSDASSMDFDDYDCEYENDFEDYSADCKADSSRMSYKY